MRPFIFNRGFSLVELSVSLVIIAVIMGSAISVSLNKSDPIKKQQTLAKMEAIEQAVAAFMKLRGRMPCPGQNELAQSNANAGREYCWGSTSKDMTASLPSGYSSTYGDYWIIVGSVPTKTLNLPDEFMLDGWGNRLDYAVPQAFSSNHGTYDAPATTYSMRNTNKGILNIIDVTYATITNEAAMVLVSHGPNGYGSWTSGGSQRAAPADAAELKNYYTAGVYAGTMAFLSKESVPSTLLPYDDIVRYRMKWQLLYDAGAVLSETACNTADIILNTPDTLVNNIYYSAYCGTTPGNSNCKNYMTMLANQVSKWCL